MILVTKWFGVFLCDGQKIKKYILFEKNPKIIAQKLASIQKGEILPEERELAQKRVQVADIRLAELGRPVYVDTSFIRPEDFSFSESLMHEAMVELGKLRTRESVQPDRLIIQAIRAIDDINESINVMSERLHEWYGLHFPELNDYAKEKKYVDLIARHGRRENIIDEIGIEIESIGGEMLDEDLDAIRMLATSILKSYDAKEHFENYISRKMEEIAPNLTTLLSANLAARLISLAGSLERLSKLPSSTVQLLGAEKAMFLHLKNHKKPPKHGIIYQHPAVHRAPYWQRGKIARSLASKITIAARVDYWRGEFIGDRLVEELDRRRKEIEKKYPTPPKKTHGKR